MAATVFLSHASKDKKMAETICQSLESRGVECWMATRDIHPGENFQEAIVRAIRAAKVMIFVFSANSNNSDEVKKEIALAGSNKLFVIPVRVEDVAANEAFAYEFATRQWIDLFNDWETSLDTLMTQIKAVTAMQSPAEADADADKPRRTRRTAADTPSPPSSEPESPTIDVDALYEQANTHARAGEYDAAIEQYNRVIGEKPDHANALNNRGNALLAKGQQEPAISDFDRAIALKPDFAAAYCNRGNAFQARGEYDRAIRDYTVALQLKPDLAAALNNRAATYDRKGLHDMARKDRAAAAALGAP
ncbi:MAG TPA: TIR domain-containing protein, partial [Caulobacteraceae bacterium]|nr:TIR domain-containing protein [Caulobacteraceae bacterium]